MRYAVLAGLVVASLAVSAGARADGVKPLGGAGQLAISDDQPLGGTLGVIGGSSLITPLPPGGSSPASFEFGTASNNGGSGTAFALAPAADYFVIPNLSVGGNIMFGILSPAHGSGGSGTTDTLFGIAPRVGYNIAFTDMISFWPKVFFGYSTFNGSSGGSGAGGNAAAIGVFAPFMFVPASHFFLGIGPNFSTQLSNNSTSSGPGSGPSVTNPKITQVGIQATIGGWLLGD